MNQTHTLAEILSVAVELLERFVREVEPPRWWEFWRKDWYTGQEVSEDEANNKTRAIAKEIDKFHPSSDDRLRICLYLQHQYMPAPSGRGISQISKTQWHIGKVIHAIDSENRWMAGHEL